MFIHSTSQTHWPSMREHVYVDHIAATAEEIMQKSSGIFPFPAFFRYFSMCTICTVFAQGIKVKVWGCYVFNYV